MYERIDHIATGLGSILMKLCAIAVILMMLAVLVQVAASRAGVTTVLHLPNEWPLFGTAITLNSLTDLQWYLLALIALLPAGIVWLRGVHVRVDFLFANLGPRGQAVIDLIGLVVFALPFLILIVPDAWAAVVTSFNRGESSPDGGMTDRFIPRASMPIGLTLLGLALLFEAWRYVRKWRDG